MIFFFIETEGISSYTLEIINRWGNKVGCLSGEYPYWDGKYNGVKVTSGTYYYKLIYTDLSSEIFQKTRFIHIVY